MGWVLLCVALGFAYGLGVPVWALALAAAAVLAVTLSGGNRE